ncbi:RagB/SusD family nutrient uptake outer membrane protein (plasmid) [Flammeovirga sp. MY04]|uniref:RagB/SusD family nutrient uptake outer membrane protein n=1 Tax=Flammeovirga sp. MY04 TaxID=1191459 RepID=UPI0008062CB8|nr:RagB/SusD family nutrient uptake outer membrane protein [Flammeovirga sp. MY04]ANQ52876.1 RagB/SusD family nutrient uptake outer membrane protein [Flammeovirga sp. MY04]
MMRSIILFVFIFVNACSLIDISPDHVVSTERAFDRVIDYQMALNRVYYSLTSPLMNVSATDYATDDYTHVIEGYAPTNYYIYQWNYHSQPQPSIWRNQYKLISETNVIIDNYSIVHVKNDEEKTQKDHILAQALGLRAWFFFNLVYIYAPAYNKVNESLLTIPLKLKLDREYLSPASLKDVFLQIHNDLEKAEELLSDFKPAKLDKQYLFDLDAVRALIGRIALYQGDYKRAKKYAGYFINIPLLDKKDYWKLWGNQYDLENNEVIFMTHNLSDSEAGALLDYHQQYETNNVVLNSNFVNTFDKEDIRIEDQYIHSNTRRPLKYLYIKNSNNDKETLMLNYKYFRLAEQYLIYAESVLKTNEKEALTVFNQLRTSRGVKPLMNLSLNDIIKERRKEFFQEGLRFYDLKRISDKLDIVVERANGNKLIPKSDKYTFDIPLDEVNSNPYIDD